MVKFADAIAAINKNASRSYGDNVILPFFKPADGRTKILFLSREDSSEDGVPPIELYQSYKLPSYPYERAYQPGDTLDPAFVAAQSKEGKTPNPQNFAYKGFAYIFNLTAFNAKQLEKKPTNKDFQLDEAKAAKSYYSDEKYPDDFSGFMVYNFNNTMLKALLSYKEMMLEDDDDDDFRGYLFDLTRSGEGLNTSYSLSATTPYEQIDEDLRNHIEEFIDENSFKELDSLVENKRYIEEDSIPEEHSFAGIAEDKEESEVNTDW